MNEYLKYSWSRFDIQKTHSQSHKQLSITISTVCNNTWTWHIASSCDLMYQKEKHFQPKT